MVLGYRRGLYLTCGVKYPIEIYLPKKTSNIIVAGKSGSGKSLATRYYIGQMLAQKESLVFIADYKAGEEYEPFEGSASYKSGKAAIEMIEDFYDFFTQVRDQKIRLKSHYTLVIEEYSGFLSWVENFDKKLKTQLQIKIGELLAVARGLNIGIVLCVQRADASYFAAGAREQFQCILSFGRCSSEQFRMLGYAGELETNPTVAYGSGQALALIDGQDAVHEIIVPFISNAAALCSGIRSHLDLQPSLQELARAIAEGRGEVSSP